MGLAGIKVLLTRPEGQGDQLRQAITAAGGRLPSLPGYGDH